MVLAKIDLWKMYEDLQYNFLYNNDINSIHILLNLYDLEDNMTNICPKYISADALRKRVKRFLIYRKDRELISNNIALLLHEDIDRLELILYLEGYKNGYYNNKWVNNLENATIKHFDIEDMYYRNILFHYDISLKEIKNIKKDCEFEIREEEKRTDYLYNYIKTYSEKIIKNKIYNLNMYIDKQLKMEYNCNEMNIKEESFLNMDELNKIYELIVETLVKNITKMYIDANWFGINDKVINRYL